MFWLMSLLKVHILLSWHYARTGTSVVWSVYRPPGLTLYCVLWCMMSIGVVCEGIRLRQWTVVLFTHVKQSYNRYIFCQLIHCHCHYVLHSLYMAQLIQLHEYHWRCLYILVIVIMYCIVYTWHSWYNYVNIIDVVSISSSLSLCTIHSTVDTTTWISLMLRLSPRHCHYVLHSLYIAQLIQLHEYHWRCLYLLVIVIMYCIVYTYHSWYNYMNIIDVASISSSL